MLLYSLLSDLQAARWIDAELAKEKPGGSSLLQPFQNVTLSHWRQAKTRSEVDQAVSVSYSMWT